MLATAAYVGAHFVFMSYFLKADHLCADGGVKLFGLLGGFRRREPTNDVRQSISFEKSQPVCTLQRDMQLQAYGD